MEYRTKYSSARAMGFVAQDVVKLLHNLGADLPIVDRYNGYLAIQYQNTIPLLARAIRRWRKESKANRRYQVENKVKMTVYNPQDIQVAMNILNGITITGVQAARSVSALASILESGETGRDR